MLVDSGRRTSNNRLVDWLVGRLVGSLVVSDCWEMTGLDCLIALFLLGFDFNFAIDYFDSNFNYFVLIWFVPI